MSSEKKQRLNYLDVFRSIAILAVIMIHTTSFPLSKLPRESSLQPLYMTLNQMSAFAVPAFLFLSAVVLFYNYENKRGGGGWAKFYKNRLLYVLVPYVVWSVFYFVVLRLSSSSLSLASLGQLANQLLYGKAYAHLYYIFVITQFYLVFPMLLLVSRVGIIRRHLILLGILLQAAFVVVNREFIHFKSTGSLFFSYMLVIFLGAYVGIHIETIRKWLQNHRGLLFAAWLVTFIGYQLQLWLLFFYPSSKTVFISYVGSAAYYSYMALSCLMLFWLSERIYNTGWRLVATLSSWGAGSFAIYLSHPFVLLVWRQYVLRKIGNPVLFHSAVWVGGLLALLLPWAAYLILRKIKHSWPVIGRG